MFPSGLKPTPHDPRDFSYPKTFGALNLSLPMEYYAGLPKVKNQRLSQMCTAFASYVLGACEDAQDFVPEWSFAAGKTISKTDLEAPEDLRTPLKTAVQDGYLPFGPEFPSLESQSPRYCADIANYEAPGRLPSLVLASKFKKKSYFRVDGDFDSIRQVLYSNAPYHRAILTGVLWMNEWTVAKDGIVPNFAVSPGGLHCVAVIGFTKKMIVGSALQGAANKDFIVVQNSYGEEIGDKGLFYFDRETFNKYFDQPMYMLVDKDADLQPNPIGNWFEILLYKLFKK